MPRAVAVIMVLAVIIVLAVIVAMAMPVGGGVVGAVCGGDGNAIGLAGAGALQFAEAAGFAQALHVVVVAALGGAHL